MKISKIIWKEENVEHIGKHKITPQEVETLCFDDVPKIKKGKGNTYYILGQTDSGRYLFVVARLWRKGAIYIITARDMDTKEKKLYKRLIGGK